MNRHRRTLSIDDQKAIDVFLNHTAELGKTGLTRIAEPIAQRRLNAASSLLSILAELPVIEPPAGLIVRTMERIDQHEASQIGHRFPATQPNSAHVH